MGTNDAASGTPRALLAGRGSVRATSASRSSCCPRARAVKKRSSERTRKGTGGRPGTTARRRTKPAATSSAFGMPNSWRASSCAERRVGLLARGPGDEDAGGRRQNERRNLRDEPVADGQEPVALERVADAHPPLRDADREAAEDVDGRDDERRDDVPLHELHRAIHRAVELALARQSPAPLPRLVPVERAGADLRVDGHLLAGHRVEHEARGDLGDPLAPLRDDDELDDREDEEHDAADDVVPPHDERPERVDDLARVGLEQDEARRGDVEAESVQRREQEKGRERRDGERVGRVEDDQQDRHGAGEVGRDEDVEQPGRQRHDHHRDDRDDEEGQRCVGAAEGAARAHGEGRGPPHGSGCLSHTRRRGDPSAFQGDRRCHAMFVLDNGSLVA